jgi:hypothetical protein
MKVYKEIILSKIEIEHILTLLKERKEDGSYYGNAKYYYKRNETLIKKLESNLIN